LKRQLHKIVSAITYRHISLSKEEGYNMDRGTGVSALVHKNIVFGSYRAYKIKSTWMTYNTGKEQWQNFNS